jgi:ABC-type glycerol-3-phosphate transport system substrate-binding protein
MKKSLAFIAVTAAAFALAGCSSPASESSNGPGVFEQVSIYVGDVADMVTDR